MVSPESFFYTSGSILRVDRWRMIPIKQRVWRSILEQYSFLRGHYKLKQLRKQSPLNIIIGSGGIPADRAWIPTEAEYLNLLCPQHWIRYFDKNSIDAILAEHVWEHLTIDEGLIAAKQCYQYLKPGGYLRLAVPDGFHPDPGYIEGVKVGVDEHKVLYNYKTFSQMLETAGFKVKLLEYFDSNKEFHCFDWDETKGIIRRSKKFDQRNRGGEFKYSSLILDACKSI